MNKAELINAIVAKSEMSKKDADVALSAVIDSIKDALKAGEKVQIVGFGTFSVKERAARTGKNPATGEAIQIAACKVPAFAAGKALKDEIQ
jgi:DNA-binding protein HU-beta